MSKSDKLFFVVITLGWLFLSLHFGIGQATIINPKWEHYVAEGYFLFCFFITTALVVSYHQTSLQSCDNFCSIKNRERRFCSESRK